MFELIVLLHVCKLNAMAFKKRLELCKTVGDWRDAMRTAFGEGTISSFLFRKYRKK